MIFALAGNQNCGKTTLFNQLTGSNQHVGNFPGVTVERKDGQLRGHRDVTVVDLPGIYSLSPYTNEEIVTRDFLLSSHPDGVINILDATNIERNLYLSMQLIELGIPMVIALNMMDEVRSNGGTIKIKAMERELGVPVFPISAVKNEGIDEMVERAISIAQSRTAPKRQDFCIGAVHRAIHAIAHLVEDHAERIHVPARFAATKLVEGDAPMLELLALSANEQDMVEHSVTEMEGELGTDREAAMADMRYTFIERLCADTVVKPRESKEHLRSVRMDSLLTHKYLAIPIFLLIMLLIFYLTFGLIGSFLSDLLAYDIDWVTSAVDRALTAYGLNPVVHSLLIDGVFAGVGSVLSFLPTIVVLFFFLSMLEDSGYMARVAFVMDKLLRKIGLSGRSFVPIYSMFTLAFFPDHPALVMILLYAGGMLVGVLSGLLLKNTAFHGKPVPFVMELPNYRLPGAKNVCLLLWDKARDFLTRAFTVIFLATIVIWFLQTFDTRFNVVADSGQSMLAGIGRFIAPVFTPLGFNDWRASTALITGFSAKEAVVSTLAVLTGGNTATLPATLSQMFSPLAACAFLTFTLLYSPCVAAIAAVRRELGGKHAAIVAGYQCGVAWLAGCMVYQFGSLLLR